MLIRKKHINRYYTIVEVMVAMGIFLIMMTIMMQFFTSAQKVWNLASKRNMLYADARVAMNLMTREIQSMLYNNDDDGSSGIYPFWYEWTDIEDDGITRAAELRTYFYDNKEIYPYGTPAVDNLYLTALNFIATTDIKAVDEGSDVCEIRYRFIPVYFTTSSPKSANDVSGGYFQRSCIAEYDSTGVLTNTTYPNRYNFSDNPYTGGNTPAGRVTTIWSATNTFSTVISGVYSLRFTCYKWDSGLKLHLAMDKSGKDINNNDTYTTYQYGLGTGTPKPVAVRIDMKLMDPKDLKKLAYNIYVANYSGSSTSEKNAAEKQIKTLKQTMRTFSKVIYLGKAEN